MNAGHWINLESKKYFILCLAPGKGMTFTEKHPRVPERREFSSSPDSHIYPAVCSCVLLNFKGAQKQNKLRASLETINYCVSCNSHCQSWGVGLPTLALSKFCPFVVIIVVFLVHGKDHARPYVLINFFLGCRCDAHCLVSLLSDHRY